MKTSACNSFFSLPELIALVLPHLSRQDIINLIYTNCNLRDICTPFFWHSLDLIVWDWELDFGEDTTAQTRLIASPEGLQALYRNVDTVQAVYWRPDFSWYYFNAVLTYLHSTSSRSSSVAVKQNTLEDKEQETPTPIATETVTGAERDRVLSASEASAMEDKNQEETIISIEELTAAEWGGMVIPSPFPVVSLPPFLHLTIYKGMIAMDAYGLTTNLPPDYHHIPHHHQTFWFLRLNSSTLVHLELLTLDLDSSPVVRDLCRTLCGLRQLKVLKLDASQQCEISSRVLEALFFSCPESLEELYIVPTVEDEDPMSNVQLDPQEGDWDYGRGPLVLRRRSLLHLKIFEIPSSYSGFLASPLCSILEHCPALEHLVIPSLKTSIISEKVAKAVGKHCQRLVSLKMPQPFMDNKGVTMMSLAEVIPPQQLKTFEIFGYLDDFPDRMIAAWTRHSETLQRIELSNCRRLTSATLRTAVMNCRALEVLELTEFYSSKCCLTLEDAVMEKWACTKLRILDIPVKLTYNGKNPEYLNDPSKESWTALDHAHWNMLGKFYSQIGLLSDLEILDLRSGASFHAPSMMDPEHMQEIRVEETCLPGMLVLENLTYGRLGYLSRLSGLNKLLELRGSIVWENMDAGARMGHREVDWFVDNLPALRVAHFMPRENKYLEGGRAQVPELLLDLQRHRPEIDLRPHPYNNVC
ncbi:hypothetical protein BGZ95_003783 [Linnemannia exigua]|uniref:F-box domain-containing protein n=1 Tax=Linnemannia exigua TaxID=604196 RepID=A0AAD4D446_9FUNG|nr:hypothetical protein BGZ95_003783 [Linnemannia exigua]